MRRRASRTLRRWPTRTGPDSNWRIWARRILVLGHSRRHTQLARGVLDALAYRQAARTAEACDIGPKEDGRAKPQRRCRLSRMEHHDASSRGGCATAFASDRPSCAVQSIRIHLSREVGRRRSSRPNRSVPARVGVWPKWNPLTSEPPSAITTSPIRGSIATASWALRSIFNLIQVDECRSPPKTSAQSERSDCSGATRQRSRAHAR